MIVKDQVKGMIDDAAGRAKRQVGNGQVTAVLRSRAQCNK
jgi:uncharacterized protein YjbJ (UPF0337 family)